MTSTPTNATATLERPTAPPTGVATVKESPRAAEQAQTQKKATSGADYDVLIIGSGPGGYVSAIRAAQLGLKVGMVEKGYLGGTCLNVGCIPTKAMLASVEAMATAKRGKEFGFTADNVTADYPAMTGRRDKVVEQLRGGIAMLMKKNGIDVLNGLGKFKSAKEVEVTGDGGTKKVSAANVVIATGSICSSPPIPGADLPGVVNSDQLLQLPMPPKSMVVIGAGAVGLEWGDIFHELGAHITVIEMVDRVMPPADHEISAELAKILQKKGFVIYTGVGVKGIDKKGDGLSVRYGKDGEAEKTVEAEVVLLATGRWANTANLGLESIGVQVDRRLLPVNAQMQTKVAGVYAIGDITPGPQLAHVASKGGEIAAEVIAGHKAKMDYKVIPSCVYTSPEVAWVGMTENEAREKYGDIRVGKYSFRSLGRAMGAGIKDGFVKIVAEPKYGEILGVHMIGSHVTDMIAEPTLGMTMEATVEEIFATIHAHPTLPEAFQEASLDAWHRAIHK